MITAARDKRIKRRVGCYKGKIISKFSNADLRQRRGKHQNAAKEKSYLNSAMPLQSYV